MAEHAVEDEDDDELSFHHQVPHIFRDVDWNDVAALMDRLDSGPMSEPARHLARQQHKQTILFKRRQWVNEKLVMRPSFEGYSFHPYPAREFERKSSEYLQQRGDMYTHWYKKSRPPALMLLNNVWLILFGASKPP